MERIWKLAYIAISFDAAAFVIFWAAQHQPHDMVQLYTNIAVVTSSLGIIATMFLIVAVLAKVMRHAKTWLRYRWRTRKETRCSEDVRTVSIHEASHALVTWLLLGAECIEEVTIVPTMRFDGQLKFRRENFPETRGAGLMLKDIMISLASDVGLKMVLGQGYEGCCGDLDDANRVARDLIMRIGSDDSPGLRAELGGFKGMSQAAKRRVELGCQHIVSESYKKTKALMEKHRDALHALAGELERRRTLSANDIDEVLRRTVKRKLSDE